MNITTIAVFDFDNTLIYTPEQTEENVRLASEKYNKQFVGWWGKPESLDLDLFNIQPVEFTANKYQEHIDNGDHCVLLTGRPRKKEMEEKVNSILDLHGFYFDDIYLSTGNTLDFKIKTLNYLVESNRKLKDLYFYDDRVSHFNHFVEYGKELAKIGIRFHFYRVIGGVGTLINLDKH